jgi:hypothetical protein
MVPYQVPGTGTILLRESSQSKVGEHQRLDKARLSYLVEVRLHSFSIAERALQLSTATTRLERGIFSS